MVCPRCRQDAPIVYRGVLAYCAACHAPRLPLSARAVNLAGQPSKLGGQVGAALGWVVLVGGLLLAVAALLFFQLLIPTATIGYAVGLPVALVASVIGLLLILGSRRLRSSGLDAEREARTEALRALAKHRGGAITAEDAARSLDVPPAEAEALLSSLTLSDPERVTLEVDDDGKLFYLFEGADDQSRRFGAKYRVGGDGRVRISDSVAGDEEQGFDQVDEAVRKRSTR